MTLTNEDATDPGVNHPAWKAWKLTSTPAMIENLVDRYWEQEPVMLGCAWNPVAFLRTLVLLRNSDFPRVKAAAQNRLDNLPNEG